MNTAKITLIVITAIIVAACGSSKKSATSAPAPATSNSTPPTDNFVLSRTANGIFAPGNAELTAIQTQYKDVTLELLKQGHLIYTEGACIKCHGAKNIYNRNEVDWKNIIDDMAQKAQISNADKDAVYKYVLAIKATQPK